MLTAFLLGTLSTLAATPQAAGEFSVGRREVYPCVYHTPADLERARQNTATTAWGRQWRQDLLQRAEFWLRRDEAAWRAFLPPPGACYAYGFTGAPSNGATWGTWGAANCSWEQPGQVRTTDGQVFPNAQCPDDGRGYRAADGRLHYFVGSFNAWVTEQWTVACEQLADAYVLTADEKYADRCAFFLDLLASVYPESSAGSWDYPSSPPSGRFARPWYQVARVLVHYVEARDLIANSAALDRPSLRPALEATWPAGPTPQLRAVQTADRRGFSRPGLTRRENIDRNLILDGGYYCYEHTFAGLLHNGHADYLRGALAAGALLNVGPWVRRAWQGPASLQAMIANNCDRDGRYYETSLGYAIHARDLYLTFLGPLRHWRAADCPAGYDPVADPRFRSFYRLPSAVVRCAGHDPNYGDSSPDVTQLTVEPGIAGADYAFAEELHAAAQGAAKDEFATLLRWLNSTGKASRGLLPARWRAYYTAPLPPGPATLPAALEQQLRGSWVMGQKGLAILRDGAGSAAQAAVLRFGPSLNHGHLDDLGLLYYANGWQQTYEIGYGLGSTHTQVGWARQTASHCLVTVDEQPQRGPGSGGSLHLFASLPGLQVIEADSPASYGSLGVSEYRRTVALVGAGADQILVDLFRVTGGRQHDWTLGVRSRDLSVAGVALQPVQPASLAAGGERWAPLQLPDGDLRGYPGKPYWNPPPGNGYGFFDNPRSGPANGPWQATWRLGGENAAELTAHLLAEPGDQAIVADAPGLYPRLPAASYVLWRRRATAPGLSSGFATILTPSAVPLPAGTLGVADLAAIAVAPQPPVVGSGYGPGYLLVRAAPGEGVEFPIEVTAAGEHQLELTALCYKSYATVQVQLDGAPVGAPIDLRSAEPRPQQRFPLGRHQLAAGRHTVRVALAAGQPAGIFGLQALRLAPVAAAAAERGPLVRGAQRLAVTGGGEPAPLAVAWQRGDRREVLLSAALDTVERRVSSPLGELRWRGGVVYLSAVAGHLQQVALVGCAGLEGAGLTLTTTPAWRATVTAVDPATHQIDLDGRWPAELVGSEVIFSRAEYSRSSGYRLAGLRALGGGTRLDLGEQSVELGRLEVSARPGGKLIHSDLLHEYTRSVVGGATTGFFDGKRLVGPRGETRVTAMRHGQPLELEVADPSGLQVGDELRLLDLGPGDQATVATSAWLSRQADGWQIRGSAAVVVR
ncbi:MAG: heparinase II/III family protein [Fimbriimonadaceae bacterium]|nr:heparinase II/III family protein [Fimbriimonadaceae bacterium]